MTQPVVIPGFAEAKDFVGTPLGETGWIAIDQARVDGFARATGETNWIHVDPERAARESPWKGTLIPGYLLLALVPDLLPQLVRLVGWTTGVNAGIDSCRFDAPALVGSRLRLGARLARARTIPPDGVRLTFAIRFELEGSDDTACTARVHYAYFR